MALIGTTLVHPHAHADGSSLTSAWQHWDAGWFHQITAHGYHYAATTPGKHKCLPHHPCLYLQTAFYPGYPLLARFLYELTHPFGLSVTGAMLLTNQLLVFVLAWLLCSFATTLTTDPLVGLQTVRYLLLFPFSFFLLAPFSEATFLTFVAGFLWALSARRYLVAGLFGLGASATRFVGVVLPLVLVVAYLEHHHWRLRDFRWRAALSAAIPLGGVASYALYQWVRLGDPTYSQHVSNLAWARTVTLRVWHVLAESFHPPLTAGLINGVPVEVYVIFPLLAGGAVLTYVVWRRFGVAMALLCALFILVPLLSGSTLSFNRYVLPALPCFVVLAIWGRNPVFDFAYKAVGAMLLAAFLVMFTHGVWTG